MLNSIRKFSKSIWANVLIFFIAVPFVFWGMGDVFSGGNKNTIVKINKEIISTKDFNEYINTLDLNLNAIKDNIDNSIIEQILGELIGKTIINLEIEELNLKISDSSLLNYLRNNKEFQDEENNFSRIKYEKYLLTKNFSAGKFENDFKNKQLKKILFNYISGGTYPPSFLVKKTYGNKFKKIHLQSINLKNTYRNESDLNKNDIKKFINQNKEKLKTELLTLRYAKLNPENIASSVEFNDLFFKKIDEIENSLLNEVDYRDILNEFNIDDFLISKLNIKNKNNFSNHNISDSFFQTIVKNKDLKETQLFDDNNEYILYKITKRENQLPDINSNEFINDIKKMIINENKFEVNKNLFKKINSDEFGKVEFEKLGSKKNIKVEKITIQNFNDYSFFVKESVVDLYNRNIDDLVLTIGNNNESYLSIVDEIEKTNLVLDGDNYKKFTFETTVNLKNNIYTSYDAYLQNKYNVKINQQTLDRVKNYFR